MGEEEEDDSISSKQDDESKILVRSHNEHEDDSNERALEPNVNKDVRSIDRSVPAMQQDEAEQKLKRFSSEYDDDDGNNSNIESGSDDESSRVIDDDTEADGNSINEEKSVVNQLSESDNSDNREEEAINSGDYLDKKVSKVEDTNVEDETSSDSSTELKSQNDFRSHESTEEVKYTKERNSDSDYQSYAMDIESVDNFIGKDDDIVADSDSEDYEAFRVIENEDGINENEIDDGGKHEKESGEQVEADYVNVDARSKMEGKDEKEDDANKVKEDEIDESKDSSQGKDDHILAGNDGENDVASLTDDEETIMKEREIDTREDESQSSNVEEDDDSIAESFSEYDDSSSDESFEGRAKKDISSINRAATAIDQDKSESKIDNFSTENVDENNLGRENEDTEANDKDSDEVIRDVKDVDSEEESSIDGDDHEKKTSKHCDEKECHAIVARDEDDDSSNGLSESKSREDPRSLDFSGGEMKAKEGNVDSDYSSHCESEESGGSFLEKDEQVIATSDSEHFELTLDDEKDTKMKETAKEEEDDSISSKQEDESKILIRSHNEHEDDSNERALEPNVNKDVRSIDRSVPAVQQDEAEQKLKRFSSEY